MDRLCGLKKEKQVNSEETTIRAKEFSAWYGDFKVLKNISLSIPTNYVTAVIGPSGCGKTTFVRCINRLHELTPGAKVTGELRLNEKNIYQTDPMQIRRTIGMVFQRPNPFPTMTIAGNVMAGYTLNGIRLKTSEYKEIVEDSLRKAALWDEVKDKLNKYGTELSGGQQQRLCIARAIATKPTVILFDEPCSALDPIATGKIEELIRELRSHYTIIIVTHNMQQAGRVADFTAFFMMGELIEFDRTETVFTNPAKSLTEDYITGRFG
jgi:phosphate transport system ATP-binding protein